MGVGDIVQGFKYNRQAIVKNKKTITQPSVQLDAFESQHRAEQGMLQAAANAEEKEPGWNDQAYAFFIQWLYQRTKAENFFIENVRVDAAKAGIPKPPSDRAWGWIAKKAVKDNLIKRVGYGLVSNVNAHSTPASIWKKV
jgi:hypothetical protein